MTDQIIDEFHKIKSKQRAAQAQRFFKTGEGEYGEGDKFLGISNPDCHKLSKTYSDKISIANTFQLLQSEWHEIRLTALFILIRKYQPKKVLVKEKSDIIAGYMENLDFVNNWDLVDCSSYKLLGDYLYNFSKDRSVLYKLAKSNDLWRERVAIISTLYFIKQKDFSDTVALARYFIDHKHDLIHKASGWMLREMGNIDQEMLKTFLNQHAHEMPRTMLRYSIEKLSKAERVIYMKK